MQEQLENYLIKEKIPFESNVKLQKKTWIHRGGIADVFVTPQDTTALKKVMCFLYKFNIHHLLIGSTSNLYILNSKNIPVVVSTLKCNGYVLKDGIIECDCGVLVSKLAMDMIQEGIAGFEYLTKLPGTVGGAICNNSSVKSPENSITAHLIDLEIVTHDGTKYLSKDEINLDFRTSDFKKKLIQGTILKARLKALPGDTEKMLTLSKEYEKERKQTLEKPSQNLGCTVHRIFCNGQMPLKYSIPYWIYSKIITLFVRDSQMRIKIDKDFILKISGHKNLIPYVSDKLIITFIWKDENADKLFDEYIEFMRDVYKTDKIEIEIIR